MPVLHDHECSLCITAVNTIAFLILKVGFTAVEIWMLTQESPKHLLPGMQTINGHPPGTSVLLELFFLFKLIAVCLGEYTSFFGKLSEKKKSNEKRGYFDSNKAFP